MSDQPMPDMEDLLRLEAKKVAETPPDKVPGAETLPDDVRDGHVEDEP